METLLPGLWALPNPHPMLVHFPIALWPAAFVFLVLGRRDQRDDFLTAARWLLIAGTAMGILATVSGLRGADILGPEAPGAELVHLHRNLMIAATLLAALATFALLESPSEKEKRFATWALGLALVVSFVGSDHGGGLVYGHGLGVSGVEAASPPDQPPTPQPETIKPR